MTMKDLAVRLAALEAEVRELRDRVTAGTAGATGRAWLADAGAFRDDPNFQEATEAAQAYRDSTKPGAKKAAKKGAKPRAAHGRA